MEDLINLIENLAIRPPVNLNNEQQQNLIRDNFLNLPQINEMANPNYNLIRYQADNIPCYDGNPKQLSRFIRSCEHFIVNHQDRNNQEAPINICLFDTIIGKLTGRAADLIASRLELDTWQLVKDALVTTFSDQRSEDCLAQDIICMRPDKNESILNFGLHIQDSRSLLFAKINSSNDAANIKLLKINQYDDLCLKTFINNLNYHMQLVVRLKNPNSLEQAMAFVREEENFLNFKNKSNINKNMPQASNKNNIRPPQQQNYNFNHQPQFNNPITNFKPPQFTPHFMPRPNPFLFNQNRPIQQNFRPNFMNQNHFTQPFNFTRPQANQNNNISPTFPKNNNFQGNGTIPKNNNFQRNLPEPMETSTINTRLRPNPIQRPRQNYIAEELFNQSVNSIQNDNADEALNQNDVEPDFDQQTDYNTYNYDQNYYYDPNANYNDQNNYYQESEINPYADNVPIDNDNVQNFPITPNKTNMT